MSFSLSRWPLSTKSGVGVLEDRGSSWQELGCSGHLSSKYYQGIIVGSQSVLVLGQYLLQKSFLVVDDTVKITSAPGPDHLILNLNRLEWLKIDLEWTRNGPELDNIHWHNISYSRRAPRRRPSSTIRPRTCRGPPVSSRRRSKSRSPRGSDSFSTFPQAPMTAARKTESRVKPTNKVQTHLMRLNQVCDMYDRVWAGRRYPVPALYAHLPHGVHRRLAHEELHLPLLHGARGRRPSR